MGLTWQRRCRQWQRCRHAAIERCACREGCRAEINRMQLVQQLHGAARAAGYGSGVMRYIWRRYTDGDATQYATPQCAGTANGHAAIAHQSCGAIAAGCKQSCLRGDCDGHRLQMR